MATGSETGPDGYLVYGPRSYGELVRTVPYLVFSVLGLVVVWLVWPILALRFATSGGLPLGGHGWVFFVGVVLVGLLRTGGRLRRPVRLRVAGGGVDIDGVTVPWYSVGQLVIWYPPREVGAFHVDQLAQVGVRLRAGAPLPSGVDSLVTDPSDRLAIPEPLRSKLFDTPLDVDAVLAAARVFAPPDVELVERVGDEERTLPR